MRTKFLVGLILALLGGCWLASGQTFIGRPIKPLGASYITDVAEFDGSNDILTKNISLTGITGSKTITFACWLRTYADGGNVQLLTYVDGATFFQVTKDPSNQIVVTGRQGGGNLLILTGTSSETVVAADGWTHVYVCVNLANSSQRRIYLNGIEDVSVNWSVYIDSTMDLDRGAGAWSISPTVAKLNGAISEMWFNDVYFDDPTKFISGGCPVSLGSDGSTPTGLAPALYLSRNGSGDNWRIDSSGNGNDFTVTGALTSTTGPCQ